jgi:hypothetical protein
MTGVQKSDEIKAKDTTNASQAGNIQKIRWMIIR